jgi:hypothetical protein
MPPDSNASASDAPPEIPHAWNRDAPDFEAHVLRAFIGNGRLKSIPARERKKLVVYRHLVDQVLPDPAELVPERDLNMRLALWHPDVATIRRALVDLGFAHRARMEYRRAVPIRDAVAPEGADSPEGGDPPEGVDPPEAVDP